MFNSIQNLKTFFLIGVWSIFVVAFLQAALRGKMRSQRSQRLWLIFFLSCVAFTFWGESSELLLDRFFGYRPVALLVKYICLVSVAHLFSSLLGDVKPGHELLPIKWLAPVAIVLGLLGFLAYNQYMPFSREDLRYHFIGTRDGVVMVYALLSFIPGILAMRRSETVGVMCFKLNMSILCSSSFVVTALGSILAALFTLTKIGDPTIAASVVQPFVVLGIISFVLIMIPYEWFMGLLHLRRFYTYQRLLRLEQRLLQQLGIERTKRISITLFTAPKELELAIYRIMISLLDAYPSLANDEQNTTLYKNLRSCVETTPNYDDLVQKMARL